MTAEERGRAYWRRNLKLLAVLLAVWFTVSYGLGILLAEALNTFRVPGTGFPVGFWFAQQGAIYSFVIVIFIYVRRMNRLDDEFVGAEFVGADDADDEAGSDTSGSASLS